MPPSRSSRPNTPTPATPSLPPDHIGLLVAAVVMMIVGWGGLYRLVSTTLPRIGGELWLFFILLLVAITGTAVPIVRYLNVRFTPMDVDVPPGGVIVRQSIWIGLFVVTCSWLQIPRALSLPLALFIVLVLVVVEVFLRSRELIAEREAR
jgi:hypothetical protein